MKTQLLALALLAPLAALGQTRPKLPDLPPPSDTGFFIRFDADGKKLDKKLYTYGGTYDHVILRAIDGAMDDIGAREFDLQIESLKTDAHAQGLRLWIHDKLFVRPGPPQTFTLTGPSFCTGMDGQPDRVPAEAFYMTPVPRNPQPFNMTNYWPNDVMYDGNRDQDEKNKGSIGFQTQHKGIKGNFEGTLTITRIDTTQQIIEGRFEFSAVRMINLHRGPHGEWEGRCSEPADFRADQVKVTGGEFRMHYCFDPMRPSNSRYCASKVSQN